MTAISDPRSGGPGFSVPGVNYEEPPIKPPPILVVGPLAWVRNNLFSSWFDALLSIGAAVVAVTVVLGGLRWAIYEANWFVINFNLRLFMLGRYEPSAEWRVQVALVLAAFVIGFGLAIWMRLSRVLIGIILVLLALSFVVPVVVSQTVPAPDTYLAAGNVAIVSGSSTITPLPQIGFVARANETISIDLAEDLAASDGALTGMHSFADNGANLLRGAAVNRLDAQARIAEIEAALAEHRSAGPTLTAGQVETLTAELERLSVPPPVTETYRLNEEPVHVRVLRGTTMEPLAEGDLTAGSDPITVTLPDDGWYVLESTVPEDAESVALLRLRGLYPHLQREFSQSEVLDEQGEVISSAGRVTQSVRMTDAFTTEEARPQIDGDDVPAAIVIDMQYRGDGTFADYLRLYLAPFLDLVNEGFLFVVAAGALGYSIVRFFKRVSTNPERSQQRIQRAGMWMFTALPIIIFVLVYGVGGPLPLTDTRRWGGLMLTILLTVVGIIASFPIGVLLALGRRSKLPVVSTVSTLYIEFVRGVPLLTVLFMAQLLVPLLNPTLAELPNVFRAMVGITLFSAAYLAENVRGGLQSVPPGQEEAAKALGMSGWQITLFITLPQALRAVIPALVGQFISLFKDTSLVAIVGLIDLTGISENVVAQTEFLGLRREAFIFITVIYFSFSYLMAFVSRRIEESGAGVARRF